MSQPDSGTETDSLAVRAGQAFAAYRGGDIQRMDELVDLLTSILWHTARGQGLSQASAQDVVQTAWLRLIENAERITDARAVMGWLIVTVRRESWRVAKATRTGGPGWTGEPDAGQPDARPDPGEHAVLAADQQVLWRHILSLPAKCQALLRVIAFSDRPDYASVAASLQMPVGSIGPTRGRCLEKLRTTLGSDTGWAV
jgi:RNA polymerase sigma factor (sigma-70 family)